MNRKDAAHGQGTGFCSPWLTSLRIKKAKPYLKDGSAVLDIGCGRAALLDVFRPGRYVGVDILDVVLDANSARHPQHTFVGVNIEKDSLEHLGKFDTVVMLAILEHLVDPVEALRNVATTLAPGGKIVLTTPHPRGERILEWGAVIGVCSPEANEEHQPLMDGPAIRACAERAGLRVTHYKRFLARLNQLAVIEHR